MPTFIRLGTAAIALTLALAPLGAQTRVPSTRLALVEFTPYAGYLITGNLVEAPLGINLASASGPLYGAQLTVPLTRLISITGNLATSKGNLEVGLPILGGVSVGTTETLLFDGGLQFSAPALSRGSGALVPFVQIGAGGMRQDFAVAGLQNDVVSFAWNAGIGLDLAFASTFGIRLLAKDYISKFDLKEATGIDIDGRSTDNWSLAAGIRFSF
jgi:hypothetical protein